MAREELEQYNSMVELLAEVDKRPKTYALKPDEFSSEFYTYYDMLH